MDITGIGSVADLIKSGIDRIWPDKTKAAELKAQVDSEQAKAALATLEAELNFQAKQIDTDTAEAKSNSLFVAGWRPFIGWVCGAAFGYCFIIQPFAQFLTLVTHAGIDPKTFPTVDLNSMMPVLLGMLGLGTMRTVEKIQGAAPRTHA